MPKILEIINQLENNNSRNFKIEYLQKHKDNMDLKQVCFLALDPFTQFYIRKIPNYIPNDRFDPNQPISLKEAMNELGMLSSRTHTGHAGIKFLTDVLNSLSIDNAKVIERIIEKDLKCGVAASTVNKVWPGLITEYPVMLCTPFNEKFLKKIKFPAYVQTKEDGMRFNAIVESNKVSFRSRNGKLISLEGSPIETDFTYFGDGVYDGELLVGSLDRKTGNGILNKAVKGKISVEEAAMVRAVIWDFIPLEDFYKGYCSVPYKDRLYVVQYNYNSAEPKNIISIKNQIVDNPEEATIAFLKALERKEEGIILKGSDIPWEDKRSTQQIKYKNELECDLKITGIKEHTEVKGTLGAFELSDETDTLEVSCGSGLSELQRKKYWDTKMIGKIVSLKYNERIKNKKGKESLFLPIFIEIRDDKNIADKIGDIK